jgi:hypothetical protein
MKTAMRSLAVGAVLFTAAATSLYAQGGPDGLIVLAASRPDLLKAALNEQ